MHLDQESEKKRNKEKYFEGAKCNPNIHQRNKKCEYDSQTKKLFIRWKKDSYEDFQVLQ